MRLFPLPTEFEHLAKMLETLALRCYGLQTFHDFLELSALVISNTCDEVNRQEREVRYFSILSKYRSQTDRMMFPTMFEELVNVLNKTKSDVLGPITASLGLSPNQRNVGWQSWSDSLVVSRIVLDKSRESPSDLQRTIERFGFIEFYSDNCGPGSTLLALAQNLGAAGYNPRTQLHCQAVDTLPWIVHMAYCQLSLTGIPGIVMLGHLPTSSVVDSWFTPEHIYGGWTVKLHRLLGKSDEPPPLEDLPLFSSMKPPDAQPQPLQVVWGRV